MSVRGSTCDGVEPAASTGMVRYAAKASMPVSLALAGSLTTGGSALLRAACGWTLTTAPHQPRRRGRWRGNWCGPVARADEIAVGRGLLREVGATAPPRDIGQEAALGQPPLVHLDLLLTQPLGISLKAAFDLRFGLADLALDVIRHLIFHSARYCSTICTARLLS